MPDAASLADYASAACALPKGEFHGWQKAVRACDRPWLSVAHVLRMMSFKAHSNHPSVHFHSHETVLQNQQASNALLDIQKRGK